MNDNTLEWSYNSVKIKCVLIQKEGEKCNDDKYGCGD